MCNLRKPPQVWCFSIFMTSANPPTCSVVTTKPNLSHGSAIEERGTHQELLKKLGAEGELNAWTSDEGRLRLGGVVQHKVKRKNTDTQLSNLHKIICLEIPRKSQEKSQITHLKPDAMTTSFQEGWGLLRFAESRRNATDFDGRGRSSRADVMKRAVESCGMGWVFYSFFFFFFATLCFCFLPVL